MRSDGTGYLGTRCPDIRNFCIVTFGLAVGLIFFTEDCMSAALSDGKLGKRTMFARQMFYDLLRHDRAHILAEQ